MPQKNNVLRYLSGIPHKTAANLGKRMKPHVKTATTRIQDMPTSAFNRRREETTFKRESISYMTKDWLEWKATERGFAYDTK